MRKVLLFSSLVLLIALGYIHFFLPEQLEPSFNVYVDHPPYAVSGEAQALHASLFVADLHSDSLLWKRDLAQRKNVGHMDVPRLREGNVALQVLSAVTKSPSGQNYDRNAADSDRITLLTVVSLWPPRTWGSLYERAVYQLEKLHAFAANTALSVITNKREMQEFLAARERGDDVIASVYLIEGAHPLEGDLDKLDALYEQGLRIAGLTHFFDNELGGSLHGMSGEGLSDFGEAAVRRMNELGIIIDVAHASPQMVRDVLRLSDRPPLLSHGGMKGACNTPRNLDDELMQAFADAGGLIGIGFWAGAVCDPTPRGVVASIRYAIDLLGIDHVALGSDYDGTVAVTFDVSELAVLTQAMLDANFSEAEIRQVMGENVRRFMLENLPD